MAGMPRAGLGKRLLPYLGQAPGFYLYKTISVGYVNVVSDSKLVNGYKNYEDEHNQTRRLGFKQVNSIYTAQNVPALIEEDYVDNLKNYRSAIRHELETVRFPEQPVKDYSVTWEGVAKTIYKDKNFGCSYGNWKKRNCSLYNIAIG